MSFRLIAPCPSSNSYEVFFENFDFDKLKKHAHASTHVMLLMVVSGKITTVYKSGRVLVKDTTRKEAEEVARVLERWLNEG